MIDPQIFNGSLNLNDFLNNYWQKRPVVIRNAINPSQLNLDPNELAGLACEEDVESRLIKLDAISDWSLIEGPLDEAIFETLPDDNWTLLVQDVDKHIAEVADLLDYFNFLPNWRIDDIMISYATDQGSVGPHTDNYDVFLIQAQGQRHWQINEGTFDDKKLIENCPIKVLSEFTSEQEWTLNPGDILYLPPRVAHWGRAIGDCTTYSLGLRGPGELELAQAWLSHVDENTAKQDYFKDDLKVGRASTTLITEPELRSSLNLIQAIQPKDNYRYHRWFGCFITEPKADFEVIEPDSKLSDEKIRHLLLNGKNLIRHPWVRIATLDLNESTLGLCLQGQCLEITKEYKVQVAAIAQHRKITLVCSHQFPPEDYFWTLLGELYNQGFYLLDD